MATFTALPQDESYNDDSLQSNHHHHHHDIATSDQNTSQQQQQQQQLSNSENNNSINHYPNPNLQPTTLNNSGHRIFEKLSVIRDTYLAFQIYRQNAFLYFVLMFIAILSTGPTFYDEMYYMWYVDFSPLLNIFSHTLYPTVMIYVRGCLLRSAATYIALPNMNFFDLLKITLKKGMKNFISLLLLRLISWILLASMGTSIAFTFILVGPLAGIASIMILCSIALYLIPGFIVAGNVIMIEEQNMCQALQRGFYLVKDKRSYVILTLGELCLYLSMLAVPSFLPGMWYVGLIIPCIIVPTLIVLIFFPCYNILKTIVYVRLCMDKEGLSQDELMTRLQMGPHQYRRHNNDIIIPSSNHDLELHTVNDTPPPPAPATLSSSGQASSIPLLSS